MVARGGRRRPTSGLPRPPIEYEDKYHSARQTSDSVKPTTVFLLDGWRAYGSRSARRCLPRATRRSTPHPVTARPLANPSPPARKRPPPRRTSDA
ncbi:hypothetical protein G6F57_020691 [Rhizopus arrhizus]|nr:hypothetical protein G6F57_020691 [Rhizopus arrhizus]